VESLADHDGKPLPDRYFAAIEALAELHVVQRSSALESPSGGLRIGILGTEHLVARATIFSSVYPLHRAGKPRLEHVKSEFERLWVAQLERLVEAEQAWVLHPVGSRNVFWLADQTGLKRVGVLPLDGVYLGPTAHDVASLCQDREVTIEVELEAELKNHYVALRKAAHPRFDGVAFDAAYTIMATLHATAALGLTAAKAAADPAQAERRFPRLLTYLRRDLAHPVLSPLAAWYERHLPPRS
jgi:aminoglycoside/choline kinase family phosphotransferase